MPSVTSEKHELSEITLPFVWEKDKIALLTIPLSTQRHQAIFHGGIKPAGYQEATPSVCKKCAKSLMGKGNLTRHLKSCKGRKIKSRYWPFLLSTQRHHFRYHAGAKPAGYYEPTPSVCKKCAKSYKHKSTLVRHLKSCKNSPSLPNWKKQLWYWVYLVLMGLLKQLVSLAVVIFQTLILYGLPGSQL